MAAGEVSVSLRVCIDAGEQLHVVLMALRWSQRRLTGMVTGLRLDGVAPREHLGLRTGLVGGGFVSHRQLLSLDDHNSKGRGTGR